MQDQKKTNTEIKHASYLNVVATSFKFGFTLNFEFCKAL